VTASGTLARLVALAIAVGAAGGLAALVSGNAERPVALAVTVFLVAVLAGVVMLGSSRARRTGTPYWGR